MFSKEQEQFLADLADKGLVELAEIKQRNEQIEAEAVVSQARSEKKAELEAQAKALIDEGLEAFEASLKTN